MGSLEGDVIEWEVLGCVYEGRVHKARKEVVDGLGEVYERTRNWEGGVLGHALPHGEAITRLVLADAGMDDVVEGLWLVPVVERLEVIVGEGLCQFGNRSIISVIDKGITSVGPANGAHNHVVVVVNKMVHASAIKELRCMNIVVTTSGNEEALEPVLVHDSEFAGVDSIENHEGNMKEIMRVVPSPLPLEDHTRESWSWGEKCVSSGGAGLERNTSVQGMATKGACGVKGAVSGSKGKGLVEGCAGNNVLNGMMDVEVKYAFGKLDLIMVKLARKRGWSQKGNEEMSEGGRKMASDQLSCNDDIAIAGCFEEMECKDRVGRGGWNPGLENGKAKIFVCFLSICILHVRRRGDCSVGEAYLSH
ncbi:hypothetical protein VNO78_24008 [Psophocarpus tetragonolobus]|uniref:Uncharacterized protein n=1 Tax=Psophocarpus tetragonolobus TaxID=3891 RepID=A0AAN9XE41_PSOTE